MLTSFYTPSGVNCLHGDGDIYNAQNIIEFAQYVVSQTETLGVHVMVADGVRFLIYFYNTTILKLKQFDGHPTKKIRAPTKLACIN